MDLVIKCGAYKTSYTIADSRMEKLCYVNVTSAFDDAFNTLTSMAAPAFHIEYLYFNAKRMDIMVTPH